MYHDKIDEFSCNSIYLEFYNYNLTRQTPIFPQISAIRNKENIESLDFRRPNISPEFKRDIFYEFENVKKLIANYKYKKILPKLFPNLEAYSAGSAWQNNPLNSIGDAWPKLKYLDLRMFRGDLKVFAGRDIRQIFLTARKINEFNDVAIFPNLEVLNIEIKKGKDNISKLSQLKSLKYLSIWCNEELYDWENFYSPSLKRLRTPQCPIGDIKAHFPNLEHYQVSYYEKGTTANKREYGDPAAFHFYYTDKVDL